MTPAALVRTTRRDLGLSVQGFADALGVRGERTVRRWEAGQLQVPGPVIVLCQIWGDEECPISFKPTTGRGADHDRYSMSYDDWRRGIK